jgi:hypothetical protein
MSELGTKPSCPRQVRFFSDKRPSSIAPSTRPRNSRRFAAELLTGHADVPQIQKQRLRLRRASDQRIKIDSVPKG